MRALHHPSLHQELVATLKPADMTERQCNEAFLWREGMIPDFPTDLNAMHEAEESLYPLQHQQFCLFLHKSIMGTMDNFDINGTCNLECISRVVKSTAAQRAEALLRTIGKWTEEDKPITASMPNEIQGTIGEMCG